MFVLDSAPHGPPSRVFHPQMGNISQLLLYVPSGRQPEDVADILNEEHLKKKKKEQFYQQKVSGKKYLAISLVVHQAGTFSVYRGSLQPSVKWPG